jgi:hypothetical protein
VWVICKEHHYSVLFARDSRANENCAQRFDVVYYDELMRTDDRLLLTITLPDSAVVDNKKQENADRAFSKTR